MCSAQYRVGDRFTGSEIISEKETNGGMPLAGFVNLSSDGIVESALKEQMWLNQHGFDVRCLCRSVQNLGQFWFRHGVESNGRFRQ